MIRDSKFMCHHLYSGFPDGSAAKPAFNSPASRLLTTETACIRQVPSQGYRMSKSVDRVSACLVENGVTASIRFSANPTRTARQAAIEAGCELNQIVKSMVFAGSISGDVFLFLTAGEKRISLLLAEQLAGEPIARADPDMVRRTTGFSIGGVAPIAHATDIRKFIDRNLLNYQEVWAAAGTPNHVFKIDPNDLVTLFGAEPADFAE